MRVIADASEHSIAVSVGDIPAMLPISVMIMKLDLEENILRVWAVNRMTHRWSLCAEATILSNIKLANGNSGQSTELIPPSLLSGFTDIPEIEQSASK